MKVFFSSCTTEKSENQSARLERVRKALSRTNWDVDSYIYDLDSDQEDGTFSQIAERINKCNVFVAEMSQPSQTLGFQCSFALHNSMPSLYLYDDTTRGKPDSSLTSHPSRLFKIMSYNDDNIVQKLKKFEEYAVAQLNSSRTSFMSTAEIDEYIDEQSRKHSQSKSEIIRHILHKAAANQEDYF